MTRVLARLAAGLFVIGAASVCEAQNTTAQLPPSPAAIARADSGRPPFTDADVQFMTVMIAHHAQARATDQTKVNPLAATVRDLADNGS